MFNKPMTSPFQSFLSVYRTQHVRDSTLQRKPRRYNEREYKTRQKLVIDENAVHSIDKDLVEALKVFEYEGRAPSLAQLAVLQTNPADQAAMLKQRAPGGDYERWNTIDDDADGGNTNASPRQQQDKHRPALPIRGIDEANQSQSAQKIHTARFRAFMRSASRKEFLFEPSSTEDKPLSAPPKMKQQHIDLIPSSKAKKLYRHIQQTKQKTYQRRNSTAKMTAMLTRKVYEFVIRLID